MQKEELLRKVEELNIQKAELKIQLELYIQKWLDGETILTNIDDIVARTNERIDNIGKQAEELMNQYLNILERENNLVSAERTVKFGLGVIPDELIITDLGETTEDTKEKTSEELKFEKNQALAEIRNLIMERKISFSEASELKNKVELIYPNKEGNKTL